jgi:hypothetical protein
MVYRICMRLRASPVWQLRIALGLRTSRLTISPRICSRSTCLCRMGCGINESSDYRSLPGYNSISVIVEWSKNLSKAVDLQVGLVRQLLHQLLASVNVVTPPQIASIVGCQHRNKETGKPGSMFPVRGPR